MNRNYTKSLLNASIYRWTNRERNMLMHSVLSISILWMFRECECECGHHFHFDFSTMCGMEWTFGESIWFNLPFNEHIFMDCSISKEFLIPIINERQESKPFHQKYKNLKTLSRYYVIYNFGQFRMAFPFILLLCIQ